MTEKKKRKRLTIEDRIKIIEKLDTGVTATNLAAEYEISVSGVSKMKKNKENYLLYKKVIEDGHASNSKKKATGIEISVLDKSLYKWYMEKKSLGETVSGPTLREKALSLNQLLNGPSTFKASSGWLEKFKRRHAIGELHKEPEKSPIPSPRVSSLKFCEEFSDFVRKNGYKRDQVYNAAEAGLSWKMLPNPTLVNHCELKDTAHKLAKDRVTVMISANSSGSHKLPLLVIGKVNNPRCFKNIKMLPVAYKGQKNGCVDTEVFTEWYKQLFLPAIEEKHRQKGEKCLLILDNTRFRASADELNSMSDICTVMFFPTNVASLIQPMDQGIIEKMKRVYKKNWLSQILLEGDLLGVVQLIKSLTMVNCCNYIAQAWESVTETNIKMAWESLYRLEDVTSDRQLDSDVFLEMLRQIPEGSGITIEETNCWLQENDDSKLQGLTHEENRLSVQEENNDDPTEAEGDEDLVPSAKDALLACNNLEIWLQTRTECTQEHLATLRHLRQLATQVSLSDVLV